MLKSEPPSASAVCCPSCGSSLEGEFDEASVGIDDGEMSVSVVCEECEEVLSLSVGPIPPDGRKVDVVLGEERL
ncbi:MAG: hypothetical protein U5J64_12150 [Halobacteriales archaeon]|nr:hypothetical protein [Halobacteriales archaeon]